MAQNTALKTSDGVVLTSTEGDVLIQNYQFGNALKTYSPSIYLRTLDNLGLTRNTPFTAYGYINWKGVSTAQPFVRIPQSNGTLNLITSGKTAFATVGFNGTNVYDTQGSVAKVGSSDVAFLAWINLSQTVWKNRLDAATTTYAPPAAYTSEFTHFIFGFGSANGGVTGYNQALTDVRVFDRELLAAELNFAYNNRAGNPPLLTEGMIANWKFEKAEILTFKDSVQRVGVADESGEGNHLYFVGLPAGTLQQQADYVNNNNYFTLFL